MWVEVQVPDGRDRFADYSTKLEGTPRIPLSEMKFTYSEQVWVSVMESVPNITPIWGSGPSNWSGTFSEWLRCSNELGTLTVRSTVPSALSSSARIFWIPYPEDITTNSEKNLPILPFFVGGGGFLCCESYKYAPTQPAVSVCPPAYPHEQHE